MGCFSRNVIWRNLNALWNPRGRSWLNRWRKLLIGCPLFGVLLIISSPLRILLSSDQLLKMCSVAEEFLTLTPKSTIDVIKGHMETAVFVVLGTVDSVVADTNWWYNSCNVCRRKVYLDSDMYYCEHCVRHVVLQTPRYRINLRVIDETESAVFTLFDRDATLLLGRTCANLLDGINQETVNKPVPNAFDALIGKTMLFKVDVSPPRSMRFGRTFSIRKICFQEDIIDRFKGQQTLEAGGNAGAVAGDAVPTDNVVRLSFQMWTTQMQDTLGSKKKGDTAFRQTLWTRRRREMLLLGRRTSKLQLIVIHKLVIILDLSSLRKIVSSLAVQLCPICIFLYKLISTEIIIFLLFVF